MTSRFTLKCQEKTRTAGKLREFFYPKECESCNSISMRAGLQISMCIGYDFCQPSLPDLLHTRDGRIVTFCRIPDSVNRRLIPGRFWIRIRIFDVTLPLVYTYKKLQQITSSALFFSVIFNHQ